MSAEYLSETCTNAPSDRASLVVSHADWLRRLIDRRIRPLDCGEEVLQEVLIAATRSNALPEDADEHPPWLARVAIRQCALALRTWGRRQRRETHYAVAQQDADHRLSDDPIYSLIASEQRDLVRQQLGQLEPLYRDLLILKYVHGCTYREMADRLGMEVGAVEYRLSEAKRMLRRQLVAAGLEGNPNDE